MMYSIGFELLFIKGNQNVSKVKLPVTQITQLPVS